MNFKDDECLFCGSTLYKRDGKSSCSGDNLPEVKTYFDLVLGFENSDKDEYQSRTVAMNHTSEYLFDLFMDYKNRKDVHGDDFLECIYESNYYKIQPPSEPRLPMPKSYIDFPDLAEVYIAEIMLGRELTGYEKDGRRLIPKIDENGNIYLDKLTWILYPHSYMSNKKATGDILTDEPLGVIFDIEAIRNLYKGRDGNVIDG